MFCSECSEYSKCIKLCDKVRKYLKECGIYGSGYIRPRMTGGKAWRELPLSERVLEDVATERAYKLKFAHKPRKAKEIE